MRSRDVDFLWSVKVLGEAGWIWFFYCGGSRGVGKCEVFGEDEVFSYGFRE